MEKSPLTLRCFLLGTLGLFVITASSMYISLKTGALPWPTVFVTVLSAALLSRAKNVTLEEINTTHTMMSAGAMVAGGLAFTLPGIWMADSAAYISPLEIAAIAVSGAVLGTLFTIVYRKKLIVEEKLPYPIGEAAYNTLLACKNGKGAKELFSSTAFAALFAFLRDKLLLIPPALTIISETSLTPSLFIWVSPLALGIGAMIGTTLSFVCFAGAVFGHFILSPVGIHFGFFENVAEASSFRESLGIGIMIGTGLAVAAKAIFSLIKKTKEKKENKERKPLLYIILSSLVVAVFLIALTEITFTQSLLLLLGIYLTAYLSALLTGETGVNPMEVFAILVLLAISVVLNPSFIAAYSITGVVAVACGLTGDVMNDLKEGHMIGTRAKYQIIAEGFGGIIGALIATFSLLLLKKVYGGFGTEIFPAPQARMVSQMASGIQFVNAFVIGAAIGVILLLLKAPSATLGLGVYLPTTISTAFALGAFVYLIIRKVFNNKDIVNEKMNLIASGFLGGEGIMGVIIALLALAGK